MHNWNLTTPLLDFYFEGETIEVNLENSGNKKVQRIERGCTCTSHRYSNDKLTLWIDTELVKNKLNKFIYDKMEPEERLYKKNVDIIIYYKDKTYETLTFNFKIKELNVNTTVEQTNDLEG